VKRAYAVVMRAIDIAKLSTEERLELLEQLWDSLADTPEAIPLTDAQREGLDRKRTAEALSPPAA